MKGCTFYSSVPCPGTNLAIHPCPSVPPTQAWPAPLSPHGNVRPLHDHNHETPSLDLRNSELWDPGQPQSGVTWAPAIAAPLWKAQGLGHIFRPIGKVTSRPSALSGPSGAVLLETMAGDPGHTIPLTRPPSSLSAIPALFPPSLPQPCHPSPWPHPSPAGHQEVSSP